MQSSPLFRREVIRFRAERLHGNVGLATPMSWQVIGFLLLAMLIAATVFLAIGTYARVETAQGAITLDKGVASIMASRAGVVRSIEVQEGQSVRAGDVLARIRSEEDMLSGDTAPQQIATALAMQDQRLGTQSRLIVEASLADAARVRSQIEGATAEIARLDEQLGDQQRLVAMASADLTEVNKIATSGFISRRDIEAREATLISRRQQLAQLEQARTAKRTQLVDAQRSLAQAAAMAQAQVASTESSRAQLGQQRAQANLARGYALKAPVDGIITALTAKLGQATSDQPLMLVIPRNARARAELYVPTVAAGFLAAGQQVRLAVDAFPYQRFGTIVGRIASISSAAIPRQSPNGPIPVYLVTVDLPRPSVNAFGRAQPLVPGMTLTARIVTEERSLLEWLFEPLFAVRNR